jgi:hypothetical protein
VPAIKTSFLGLTEDAEAFDRSEETLAIAVVATEADKKSRRENIMELAFDSDCLERKQLTYEGATHRLAFPRKLLI